MDILFTQHFRRRIKKISILLFFLYISFLSYLLFLAPGFGRTDDVIRNSNFIPLRTIINYIRYSNTVSFKHLIINLLGNICAFVPMGFFLPIFNKHSRKLSNTLWVSALFSLTAEILQLILVVGSFDVDDILLNTVGGGFGYLIYYLVNNIYNYLFKRTRKE